jgi:hypothetical protein
MPSRARAPKVLGISRTTTTIETSFSTLRYAVTLLATIALMLAFAPGRAAAQVGPAPFPQPPTTLTPPPVGTPAPGLQGAPEPSESPSTPRPARLSAFGVTAKRVAFYSNRYVLTAEGAVKLQLGDGTRISANTFFMDLRLNRFVAAGDVTLVTSSGTYHGAAFSEYFDFDRAYFIPVTSEPDRWTYTEGQYAHPLFGREMPGDAFFLPDLSGQSVFCYSKKAVVDPRQSIRFTPASLNFGLTFVPFPTYFLNFSSNPNFAQNALPGSEVDGPYDFAGGAHGLATAHLRYDPADNVFFAYEQHQVSANHYLVFAVSPLTRPLKVYNLLGFDRLSPKVEIQVSLQETAFQHDFSQPLSATAYGNLEVTAGLHHSYLQLNADQYYESLLSQPQPGIGGLLYYGDPSHNWVPDHPNDVSLSWIGYRNPIGKLPLYLQLRSSIGLDHDWLTPLYDDLPDIGTIVTQWSHGAGMNVTTQQIKLLPDRSGQHRDLLLTASFDKQRQWFSMPHYIDTQVETASLSRAFTPKVNALVSYSITNTGDFWGSKQLDVYPPTSLSGMNAAYSPFTLEQFPGYSAFRGFATVRSLNEQLLFTPTTRLTLTFSMRENHDFPVPIPGLPVISGGVTFWQNYGFTPYQFTGDVRYRINNILALDVARAYYFNFGGYQRWSPEFLITLLR